MASVAPVRRHVPLAQDIETSGGRLRTKSITGKRKSRSDEENKGDGYIDAKSSKRILSMAQDLADEDSAERSATSKPSSGKDTFDFDSRFAQDDDEEEPYNGQDDNEEDWLPEDEEQVLEEEEIDPSELAIYKKFLPEGDELEGFDSSLANLTTSTNPISRTVDEPDDITGQGTNLTALILRRIAEKEARDSAVESGLRASTHGPNVHDDHDPADGAPIPIKVGETFEKVGQILSRYKSGPLPKPFKVLPTLPQWPELLSITQPDRWTPHACYRATKIFISAPTSTGQYFIENILLDRVRDEISEHKKLNIHLYNALKACFYRPAAFFKGFLFPLVNQACTLREANIISSVLAKIKVPVLHSAAALLRLCEISAEQTSRINSEAAGSANIFIRVLLAKKYALPYKVVDALVFHFLRFRASRDPNSEDAPALGASEAKLPVLWHQSLLIFAQTYRNEITEDQREALLDLLLARGHKEIGPEVRRELVAGRNRGIEGPGGEGAMDVDAKGDGDDTMVMG